MNLVGAFDAEIERRRRFGSECYGDSMIVADFAGLGITRVWARVSLANERRQIVCNFFFFFTLHSHFYVYNRLSDFLKFVKY